MDVIDFKTIKIYRYQLMGMKRELDLIPDYAGGYGYDQTSFVFRDMVATHRMIYAGGRTR